MIYNCPKCKREMNLEKNSKFCPFCGGEIHKVDISNKLAKMYTDGKSEREIKRAFNLTDVSYSQVISKLALEGLIDTKGLIQMEYQKDIEELINRDDWDGKNKSLKNALPSEVTYTTINYFTRKHRREMAAARQASEEKSE